VFSGLEARLSDHLLLPKPVHSEALEIVDHIISRSDGGKQIPHFGGSICAGDEELAGHKSLGGSRFNGAGDETLRLVLGP